MTQRAPTAPPPLPALLAKAALSLIPGASRLPFVAGGGGQVPARVLTRAEVTVDRAHLAAYDRVCGFDLSDTLPATYPSVLALGLHLALITDGSFPLPPVGLVHIANAITAHRPIAADEPLSLRVWATPLQPHRRGRVFDIHTEASVGDELVWAEVSTSLAPGRGDPDAPRRERPPSSDALPATAVWHLPADLGRRYAGVSGDWNLIHLHPLTARPFGFASAIAHGMWTKARCLAALAPRPLDSCTITVAFRKPILLPATVSFAQRAQADAIAFGVRDAAAGTPHLDGIVRPAGDQAPNRPRRRD